MKQTLLILGIIALILIPLWLFLVVPELEKVPADYEFRTLLIHSENNRFEINGDWTGIKDLKAIWEEKLTGNALGTNFEVKDDKGEIVYSIKHNFVIDRKTRLNLPNEELLKGSFREDFYFVSNRNSLENNPEAIENFLKAIGRAEEFIKDNPKDSINLASQKLKLDSAYVTSVWNDFNFELMLDSEILSSLNSQADWAIKNKLVNATEVPDYKKYISIDALKKIKPEAVLVDIGASGTGKSSGILSPITAGVVTSSILSLPFWIAEEKGYFKEEGVDVKINELDSGKTAMKALLEEDGPDIVTAAQTPILFNSFNQEDYAIIGMMAYSYYDEKILARLDKGIKEPLDLKGKKIGVTKGTAAQYFLDLFLADNGIESSEVEIVNFEIQKLASALANGEVDVISSWEPNIYMAQKQLGENSIILSKPKEAYSLFPLHVNKQDYQYLPFGYGKSFITIFKGIEKLYGLDLYHFSQENGFSDDTAGYEFLDLVPEKYKTLSQFKIQVYVEPVSGIVVNYEDEGKTYYAEQDGNKVQDISEWGNRFDYETIKKQAEIAKSEKLKIQVYGWVVPILLGLIGLILLGISLVRMKEKVKGTAVLIK